MASTSWEGETLRGGRRRDGRLGSTLSRGMTMVGCLVFEGVEVVVVVVVFVVVVLE